MHLTKSLQAELNAPKSGARSSHYYRYLGYRKNFTATYPQARANVIESLFAESTPQILANDLIAGNTFCLWLELDELTDKHAKSVDDRYARRHFGLNFDHFAPDYSVILSKGISGLVADIDASLQVHSEDPKRVDTLNAMKRSLESFRQMITNYRDAALACKENSDYNADRLAFIIANCEQLMDGAPETFAQALQLVWFCHTAFMMEDRYAMALGRIDQYLYPFYRKDIDAGITNDREVTELIANTFAKIPNEDVVNICIGGTDPDGNCQVNPLSWCVLHAVDECHVPGPNLSARISTKTPDDFLDECLKVIGTGIGYPALMNDEVNIPALERFGYSHKDACNYCMVGCVENFIPGMQPPWSDGRFDPPRFFDYIFNNGTSPFHGSLALDLGEVSEIQSMDQFMEWFEKELAYGAQEYVGIFNASNDSINQAMFPDPFLSCFCEDCIGRGLDINNGGAKYPSVHGACLMGVGTTADSLAAIEKVVFVDKAATLTDIKNAVNSNFEGYEDLRKLLQAAPKYGNNDDFVDKYAVWFVDYLSSCFDQYRTRDGGYFYVAMAANTSNIWAGMVTAATPDGRRAGEPYSDAASPTYGKDVKGPTMTMNSLVKPDYTKVACASVVNQKYSPAMFSDEKRPKLLALIKTYIKKGGQEVQINATSRKVLKDAMEHPENYPDLVVRVSGFSAFYVTLNKEVQLDILNRTQHE